MWVCDSRCSNTRTYICNKLPERVSCRWPTSHFWKARVRAWEVWEERKGLEDAEEGMRWPDTCVGRRKTAEEEGKGRKSDAVAKRKAREEDVLITNLNNSQCFLWLFIHYATL